MRPALLSKLKNSQNLIAKHGIFAVFDNNCGRLAIFSQSAARGTFFPVKVALE
jgi:hypothetical protein